MLTSPARCCPTKYVSRAVIDPNNANTAYVTFSGFGIAGRQIWKTTNLNATPPTWTNAATGLPDVPFNGFVIDPLNSNMLYAGSDIGVFVSSDGGNTWNPFGTGLPRVAVFDMAFQGPNRLVRIATHGRGAWEIAAAKAQALVTVTASPNPSTYGDNVTFTATVNPEWRAGEPIRNRYVHGWLSDSGLGQPERQRSIHRDLYHFPAFRGFALHHGNFQRRQHL